MSVRLNLEAFGTYKTTINERKGNVIFNTPLRSRTSLDSNGALKRLNLGTVSYALFAYLGLGIEV
jgi:hypothetical protein